MTAKYKVLTTRVLLDKSESPLRSLIVVRNAATEK
jgi:hypothetical protein